jgi:hypothetical protein
MYIATGIKIYKKGAGMRFFMGDSQHTSDHRESTVIDEPTDNPFAVKKSIVVTTQIQHDVQQHDHIFRNVSYEGDEASVSSYSSTKNLSRAIPREEIEAPSANDSRTHRNSRDLKMSVESRNNAPLHTDVVSNTGYQATAFATKPFDELATKPPRPSSAATHHRSVHAKRAVLNDAALAYLKVAFLMFIALFVVWV